MAARDPQTKMPDRFPRSADGDTPNVAELRACLGLSQERFAELLQVSLLAVQCWEAGYPVHRGPTRLLLRIAAMHPEVFLDQASQPALNRLVATAADQTG